MATDPLPVPRARYWPRNRRLTAALLCLWFVVTFGSTFFARELDLVLFGWPFGFWMAAQGSLIVYVLIVSFYAWKVNRLDLEHGVAEGD